VVSPEDGDVIFAAGIMANCGFTRNKNIGRRAALPLLIPPAQLNFCSSGINRILTVS